MTYEELLRFVDSIDGDKRYKLALGLDDIIKAQKVREAARVNNAGLEEQVRYLCAANGAEDTHEVVMRILGSTVH